MPTPAPRPVPLPLGDITLPEGGTASVRAVLNGYYRGLVRDFTSLPPNFLTPGNRALYQRLLALLQPMLRTDPRRIVQILRQPTHAAVLATLLYQRHAEGDLPQLNRLARELFLLVLTELAVQGALPAEGVVVPREGAWPRLRSLAANILVEVAPETEALAFGNHRLVARAKGHDSPVNLRDPASTPGAVTVTRPYHVIVEGIVLAESDNNPLSHFEAHPDKHGNQLDLGGHPASEWVNTLRQAFALVDEHLPLVGEEMRLVLRTIVPVGWDPQKHLSASYREAVGTIYMTLHPNLMTMTEALVHEFQHNKLNAALTQDELLHNAFFPLYTSPVRPDPRPLHGVVLAVHAFQPVARLYANMAAAGHPFAAAPHWHKRFRDIIRMIEAGAHTVLANGRPTDAGAALLHEMRTLDDHFRAYEAEHWPEAATHPAPELPVD